jgi:hypothetical protein
VRVESFAVAVKSVWKHKSRAVVGRRYSLGMVTKAGTLTGWYRSFSLGRMVAIFTCSRCKTEGCEARMDAYVDRDQSCGCLGKANTDHLIEQVINAVPSNKREQMAKAMEIDELLSTGTRGTHKASIGDIAVQFEMYGKLARYAMSRIRCRWKESEWIRLGCGADGEDLGFGTGQGRALGIATLCAERAGPEKTAIGGCNGVGGETGRFRLLETFDWHGICCFPGGRPGGAGG